MNSLWRALPESTDVLVVGAGPTGATLGAYLATQGIEVTVIDKKPRAELHSKAGNLWPRTLEMLGGMVPGALEKMLPKSSVLKTLTIYAYGSHMADVPNDRYDSPYPAALLNGQDVIEGALWEVLEEQNRPIYGENAFVDAQQQPDHVAVEVEHLGQKRTLRARFVVGCDSGSSRVRKAAGLDFEPESLENIHFLLMDANLHWRRTTDRDRMWMFFYDNGYYGIAPCWGGHHHFWCFEMVDEPQRRDPTVQEMTERLARVANDSSIKLTHVKWRSHIAVPRTGIAPSLQAGRFFLAGDAGHIALPVGGKGMNSGIQDALALGWRMAAVLKGHSPDTILNTYAEERLAVRKDLKKYQLKGMYEMVDPSLFQKIGMKFIAPLLAKTVGGAESRGQKDPAMLKLAYPKGTLAVEELSGSGIKAGSRAPDATVAYLGGQGVQLHELIYGELHWTALLFDGQGNKEIGEQTVALLQRLQKYSGLHAYAIIGGKYAQHKILQTSGSDKISQKILFDLDHFAHSTYSLSTPSALLIRPDGYVGYRGALKIEGIQKFCQKVLPDSIKSM